jgi:hypothetical protein
MRGDMRATDVLKAKPGSERDQAIEQWMASVWAAYKDSHEKVAEWLKSESMF